MLLFSSLSTNASIREKSMSLSYFTFSVVFNLQLEATILPFGNMSEKRGCFQVQDLNNYFLNISLEERLTTLTLKGR